MKSHSLLSKRQLYCCAPWRHKRTATSDAAECKSSSQSKVPPLMCPFMNEYKNKMEIF